MNAKRVTGWLGKAMSRPFLAQKFTKLQEKNLFYQPTEFMDPSFLEKPPVAKPPRNFPTCSSQFSYSLMNGVF
jgi:hypothetical protein